MWWRTAKIAGLCVAGRFIHLDAGAASAQTAVPEPGKSKKIDEIKKRGTLRAAAIGEFPWLPENTSGSGPQFSGPAWVLAERHRNAPRRQARDRAGQPRDQGADPGDRAGRHHHRAADHHAGAPEGRRFRALFRTRACASSASPAIPSCRRRSRSTTSTRPTSPWPISPARRRRPGRRRASRS